MNISLVAYYGAKPGPLAAFIESAQAELAALGGAFTPYDVAQVHATIVGLEGVRGASSKSIVNANYLAIRSESRAMHLDRVFDLVRSTELLPMTIRIGGFHEGHDYPFTSRGESPHVRSFSLQDSIAVAMGWPVTAGTYPTSLGQLRRAVEPHGVLHKYHGSPDGFDNDLFFVLGRVQAANVSESALSKVVQDVRRSMAMGRLDVQLTTSDLNVVRYVDATLPLETTIRYPLATVDANDLTRPGV